MSDSEENIKNQIEEPNFTQLPNILLDEWLPLLKEAELKVLLVICRKTFGWHKIKDQISLSQIQEVTGLARKNIHPAIRLLEEKGLIRKVVTGVQGNQRTIYEIIIKKKIPRYVKYPDLGTESTQRLGTESTQRLGTESTQRLGTESTPQKKELNKHINKKESKPKKPVASAPLASEDAHVLSQYLFKKIKEKDPKAKDPNFKTWSKDFDKLLKNRTCDEITEMIDNVHKDTFWASNILCPKKLATQFTKLTLHFQSENLKQTINFNKMLSFQLKKGLIKTKRKEEGWFEIQPDSIYDRNTTEYYKFTLPPSVFIEKINKAFNVKFSLTPEEVKKYG